MKCMSCKAGDMRPEKTIASKIFILDYAKAA